MQTSHLRRRLKCAFLGGGLNSAVGQVHRVAAEMDRRFELVAGCFSRHQDINRQTAEHYFIPADRNPDSLEQLLQQEKDTLDAVIILTPTPQHRDNVIQCLEAGVPVICDKSLSVTLEQGQDIKSTLQQTRGFLAVTYNYSGYPMLRELRHMMQQQAFGKIEQIHIEMPQEGFARLDKTGQPIIPQDWRLHDGDIPTISLDLGIHIHHTLEFLCGQKVQQVIAVQDNFGSFKQVIDNTMCIARSSGDIVSKIWFSKAALGHRNGLKVAVYGCEGSAEWQQMDPEHLHLNDNQGGKRILDRTGLDITIANQARYNRFKAGHPAGFIEAFANHYYDIADGLTAYQQGQSCNTPYVFGIKEALCGLEFLQALSQSSAKKQWVSLN